MGHLAEKDRALEMFAVLRGIIRASAPSRRRREVQYSWAGDALMAAFTGLASLHAALRRTGVAKHQAFATRKELCQRSEVPLAEAGAAFSMAMLRELEARTTLAVYNEVSYDGQTVFSTRWVLTLK